MSTIFRINKIFNFLIDRIFNPWNNQYNLLDKNFIFSYLEQVEGQALRYPATDSIVNTVLILAAKWLRNKKLLNY